VCLVDRAGAQRSPRPDLMVALPLNAADSHRPPLMSTRTSNCKVEAISAKTDAFHGELHRRYPDYLHRRESHH
jgi:hypothetical protein